MTSRPYELLVRFAPDGSIGGASIRTITTVNGRDYESDPLPLSGADDPVFAQFAEAFAAAAVTERDQLRAAKITLETQLETVTSIRDSLQTEVARTDDRDELAAQLATANAALAISQARIAELESQLDALLHPPTNPRHLAPFDFLALFTPAEQYSIQTSVDPITVVGRAKLQTIITYVDLDHADTIGLVRYLEASTLLAAGRADQILAGESPSQ